MEPRRKGKAAEAESSTTEKTDQPLIFQSGLDALRRRRADFFDVQGIGRLKDCQGGPKSGGTSGLEH